MNCAPALLAPSLAAVPGGRFRMGSETGRPAERPVRVVEVNAFLLGRTPVTNAEFAAFVVAGLAPQPPFQGNPAFSLPTLPVVGVTWFEAAAYAEWLSVELGGRWRLPTEVEWERAARGGLEDRKSVVEGKSVAVGGALISK